VDIDSFDPWIRPSDAFRPLVRTLSYFGLGLISSIPPPVVARDYVDAVLVPDHPGPHAELADRVLEVLDQLGWIEGVFGVWGRGCARAGSAVAVPIGARYP